MDIDAHMRTVMDLRSDSKNPKYFVGFGVRTNTFTGHTFVIFGRENPEKMVSEIELRGFYPAGGIFDGDGIIKDEFKEFIEKKYIPDYDWLVFTVDKPEYSNARSTLSKLESDPGHYNITDSNCVNLVQDMVGRIGIKSPSAAGETPYSFLRSSLEKLSTTGLLYKQDSLLKLINDGSTTAVYQDANNPDNTVVRMTGFGGFQLGSTKNGQLDGYVLTDMGPGGELIFFYNEGMIDFAKTKTIRKADIDLGGGFNNYNTPIIETYPDGSKRTIDVDTTTGNKLRSVFESSSWRCEETYSDDLSFFQVCTKSDGARTESDAKVIFENGQIKYVPSGNRCKLNFPNDYTYEGSCEYKDGAIHSKGILKYSNGDTYEGELVNWKYNGWGKYSHTEEQDRFLGIPIGNSNSFEHEGTWTNGKFDGVGGGLRPVDPQAAIPDPNIYKVPLTPPTPGLSNNNPQPSPNPAVPEPANNPEPEPVNNPEPEPANNPEPARNAPENEFVPRISPANRYYDPNTGEWRLM